MQTIEESSECSVSSEWEYYSEEESSPEFDQKMYTQSDYEDTFENDDESVHYQSRFFIRRQSPKYQISNDFIEDDVDISDNSYNPYQAIEETKEE